VGVDLSSLLPPWAPPDELPRILAIPAERERLVRAVAEGEDGWQSSLLGVGWERIVVESHADPSAAGMSIAAIATGRGEDPFDTCFTMVIEDPYTGVIGHAMREQDVLAILAVPDILVASDASAMSPQGPLGAFPVHPRNYGTFPRVLGSCVRHGVLSLEAAVRKMTSLPADRFGLGDRGRVSEGTIADLVVFDPATVRDTAEFGTPHSYPEGIDLVIVAGRVAWDGERGERAGRALRAR
jgi:N-acyl-D-amino-acid deacylase